MKISNADAKVKMPELFVFAKIFFIGIIGAEVLRIAFYLGGAAQPLFSRYAHWYDEVSLIIVTIIICLLYAHKRNAFGTARLLVNSKRIDLFAILILGVCSNSFLEPLLSNAHKLVQQSNPWLAPVILATLAVMFISSVWRARSLEKQEKNRELPQLRFLEDEAIEHQAQDELSCNDQVTAFADTVLTSGSAHSGLVFGVDGPWGVGKTSFINLAQKYWEAKEDVIIFRFEPLRYASELDLSQRFIKELTTAIQKQVYIPEFQVLASRYSRMLKGKADFSFLGFKLSLEPSNETIDGMLNDIDDVLKRARRRLIVVVDDLDRLEPKLVNNVLFTVRRTFNLSQATYILCYDLENLLLGKEDGEKAREFLEKFVTLQHSLFIDRACIKNYLSKGWKNEQVTQPTTSSESILKLSSVLTALVVMLEGNEAAQYMSIIGNLRKVKRFVNTLLLLRIETIDLNKTDFNRHALINLLLLHLHYPGVFRRIYIEETDGHTGFFSKYNQMGKGLESEELNNEFLPLYIKGQELGASFLLGQLFIKENGELTVNNNWGGDDQQTVLYNNGNSRDLEKYLKLIVRLSVPEPRDTYRLYWDAVKRIKNNKDANVSAIEKELKTSDFSLKDGGNAHNKFWNVLANESHDFTKIVAEDAINTLVDVLPQYSLVAMEGMYMGPRSSSIYTLTRLLDNAGWGRTNAQRLPNSRENVVEVADRIFGKNVHEGNGVIARLASQERGTLVWEDLLTFRLSCSADGGGQLHNLYSALVLFEDSDARTDGLVSELARKGMRKLSQ
jgi:putative Mn2+ efflux pump MntP